MTGIREAVSTIIKTDLQNITIAGGYSCNIQNVSDVWSNINEVSASDNLPVAYFRLMPEPRTREFAYENMYQNALYTPYENSENAYINTLEVAICGFTQGGNGNAFITDIIACLNNFKPQVVSSKIKTIPCVRDSGIKIVDNVITTNLDSITVVLLIEYRETPQTYLYNPVVPDILVISSPVNGAINQAQQPNIQWNSLTSALNYHLQISSDGFNTNVLDQGFININSYTISPAKALTNGITYSARVRGYNSSGWGGWSNVVSFTVNAVTVVPKNFLQITGSNCKGYWNTYSSTGLIISSGVSAILDQSGNAFHLSNATVAKRPALVGNVSASMSALSYTLGVAGGTGQWLERTDSSANFQLTAGMSGTLLFTTIIPNTLYNRYSSTGGGVAGITYSNQNYGSEWTFYRGGVNAGDSTGTMNFPAQARATNDFPCTTIPPDSITQIIITYDGSVICIYKNGILQTTGTVSMSTPIPKTFGIVVLGSYYDLNNQSTYAGFIFEAGFANTNINQSQVSQINQDFKNRFGLL